MKIQPAPCIRVYERTWIEHVAEGFDPRFGVRFVDVGYRDHNSRCVWTHSPKMGWT